MPQPRTLTAADIRAAKDTNLVPVAVPVPEWAGGEDAVVFVRGMTSAEADEFEGEQVALRWPDGSDEPDRAAALREYRARIASRVICDEVGNRLLTLDDVKKLASMSLVALQRVVEAAEKKTPRADEAGTSAAGKASASAPSGGGGSA